MDQQKLALLDRRLVEAISKVIAKRPLTVIEHIVDHGHVTTEELKSLYGYNHPPRAARDVRECGIPLETTRVTDSTGRKIGAYSFGSPSDLEVHKVGGRMTFSKDLKKQLYQASNGRCEICHQEYDDRYLQIDHRIPYQVAGDTSSLGATAAFMLLCGSCNRRKSWSCEHCDNWLQQKDSKQCQRCYWGSPQDYDHIATTQARRIDLIFSGDTEVALFESASHVAKNANKSLTETIKELVVVYVSEHKTASANTDEPKPPPLK